ncbi:pheromone autoinducer 2 transporter [Gimesia aquarii]|uniref:Pheromone autoinducer 2 transporter n=2 Tax=Gimesia aquarii TaxID=2527964 RepID=A0A517WU27_9PLAN|nr:pheromone autoinducer 2 transporter [Gimesia aquarii]
MTREITGECDGLRTRKGSEIRMTENYQKRSAITIAQAMIALVVVVIMASILVVASEIVITLFFAILFSVFLTFTGNNLSKYLSISYQWTLAILVLTLVSTSIGTITFFFVQIDQQIEKANQSIDEGAKKIQAFAEKYTSVSSAIKSTPFLSQILKQPQKQQPENQSSKDVQTKETPKTDEKNSEKQSNAQVSKSEPNLNSLPQPAKQAVSFIGQAFKTTFGLVINSIMIFFVGLFLAVAPQTYRDGTTKLVPPDKRNRATELMNQLGETLWRWLLGRFASMLVTGVGAWIILSLIGVPLAGSLGIMTGLLTFIPNIGAVIAFLLAILVALPQGSTTAAMVVPAYIILQLIESYVVTPLIQQRQVSLPPAMLISFQAIMGVLFGFLGAAVASPLLAVSKVVIQELYVKDFLECHPSSEDDSSNEPIE